MVPPPAYALPDGSLIICSRNRPRLLLETIASILEGTRVPTELVVIDQSDEPNAQVARVTGLGRCHVRYRHTRSRGLSRALNEGVRAARHDHLAFTHDDVRVRVDWYARLLESLVAAGSDVIVTGRVLPGADEGEQGFQLTLKESTEPEEFSGRVARDVLFPLNMAMHRSAFARVGPFDERLGPGTPYPAAEDNDYCFRALGRGLRIRYVPDAVLEHRAWRPMSSYLALRWGYGLGQGAFYAKHAHLRDRFVLARFASDVREEARRFVYWTVRDRRPAMRYATYGLALLVGFTRFLLFERRRIPAPSTGHRA